jgi:hypothetical protein
MRPDGRVLAVELLLPERAGQGAFGFGSDNMMLVEIGGRERTGREFRSLFAAASLGLS